MNKRIHDADLCDRIRELEEKVADLEGRLAAHGTHSYPYTVYPYVPPTSWPYTPFVWSDTTTVTAPNVTGITVWSTAGEPS